MSARSALSRLIAPLVVALSMAGAFAATADAAPWKPICASGICFNKDTQGYTNDRTYFYLTFNGTAVTHYNIIYREPGGRQIQAEILTRPGSNFSDKRSLPGTTGTAIHGLRAGLQPRHGEDRPLLDRHALAVHDLEDDHLLRGLIRRAHEKGAGIRARPDFVSKDLMPKAARTDNPPRDC